MLMRTMGLELPIYSEDTPVAWSKEEIQAAAATGEPWFVRRAALEYLTDNAPSNLRTALRLADLAINRAGEELGARPVMHFWGLYKGRTPHQNPIYDSSRDPRVPEGYSLVAQVEAVEDVVEPDTDTRQAFLGRLITYGRNSNIAVKPYDIANKGQVIFARNPESGLTEPRLVDIEARIFDQV